MSIERVYNFNAGPGALPLEVLEQFRDGFMDFGGMSIFEISHRSKEFDGILDEARSLVAGLLGVPQGYHILFLPGGASLQFAMVPLNLMDKTADYAVTGHWAKKAFTEACVVGKPRIAYSSEETGFDRVPQAPEIKLNGSASYFHITSNNTIYGTQYPSFPDTGEVPLIADMSSDIFSRPVNVAHFGLIYAAAQKNLGPAGVTLVIIRDDLTKKSVRSLPTILKFATHAEHRSVYNTPPVSAIYIMMLVLRWIRQKGGLTAIERANEEKAAIIYDALDRSKFYKGHALAPSRSRMNVVFTLPTEELTKRFLAGAKGHGMVGLGGHRSVGGVRASIYNAFPLEGVKALVEFMDEFERET